MTGAGLDPSTHTKTAVRKVLIRLVRKEQWQLRREGHWGKLYCPCGCTKITVSSTPRNEGNHAKDIARMARRCPLPEDDPRRAVTGGSQ